MTGPKREIEKLALSVGAKPNIVGQYTIDCALLETLPDVVFTIHGNQYTIPGKFTVIQAQGTCLFAFMGIGTCSTTYTRRRVIPNKSNMRFETHLRLLYTLPLLHDPYLRPDRLTLAITFIHYPARTLDFPKPGPQWILGDVFMREYYTVFNYVEHTIGLAKAIR